MNRQHAQPCFTVQMLKSVRIAIRENLPEEEGAG
jgi:hypothetical protein